MNYEIDDTVTVAQWIHGVGTVNEVALIKDRDTGSSKGFAFVTMNSQDEANQAIHVFNGRRLGNRELKVNAARPRESMLSCHRSRRTLKFARP